jgi:hypothetical protein
VTLALLSGHPDVYRFPELGIFSAPTVSGLMAGEGGPPLPRAWRENQLSGLTRAVAEVHETDQRPAAIARARAWLEERGDWATTKLFDHLLSRVYPCLGLEKTPYRVAKGEALASCMNAYPDARFIHLTRHPVTAAGSMRGHWRELFGPADHKALQDKCLRAWYTGHSNAVMALDRLPRRQWMRVRAEDLLNAPDAYLPRILEWLGLRCDGKIIAGMRQTDRWPFASFGPSGLLHGGDWKFLGDPCLRHVSPPGPAEFDGSWDISHETRIELARLAALLGYRVAP